MASSPLTDDSKKKPHSEMLGLDLSSTGRKLVRLKQAKSGWGVVGMELQPLPSGENGTGYPAIPRELAAHQVSLCLSGTNSIIRLITLPGRPETQRLTESSLREQIGVNDDYRLSFRMLPHDGKGETRLLAVAIANEKVTEVLTEFDKPQPAPLSLELSGLSALEAFMHGSEVRGEDDAFGFIESGANINLVAFFCKGQLVLLRKFDFGGEALVEKVQRHLGLEREVAMGLVSEGSFDLSDPVRDVVEPFFRQLSISKDFVERHQRTRLKQIFVSGGMSLSQYWTRELAREMGVTITPWNPFERLPIDGNIPPDLKKVGARFTSAVGAAIGGIEAS